jgi:hypothetical protein
MRFQNGKSHSISALRTQDVRDADVGIAQCHQAARQRAGKIHRLF